MALLEGLTLLDEHIRQSLNQYMQDLFGKEDAVLRAVRQENLAQGLPPIQIEPETGRMLQFLLTAISARRVVEIGTLGGYSGIWLARALPEEGHLISLEIDPERVKIARTAFERAGLASRAEVRLGHALDSLPALSAEGPFDAVFIDADKRHYPAYLTWALDNVRLGGLIMAHNAFWYGAVVQTERLHESDVQGLLSFNRQMAEDPRLMGVIIPIGDGIAVALRVH
jgi:caffeoyl-CoA O-methyltransferase